MESIQSSGFTTQILAEFLSTFSEDRISVSTFKAAKKCIIDITAASLAGFDVVSSTAAKETAKDLFASGACSVWYSDLGLNAPGAAYVNSSFASALDLDDGHREAMGHPGAAIIPAALAVAQETHASGIDFLAAVVIGYEVAIRVASARDHEKLTTLSSGKWCPFGVAAAGGWLYGLSPQKLAQAISIAGVQAPELSASGYSKIMGNHVKEGIPWSTATGLSAVMLARKGFSGPLDILDHPDFFDIKKILSNLGKDFAIENVYFKPYACCRWIHSAIDALLILMELNDLASQDITGIDVFLFKRALMLTNQTCPETVEGAQYSVQYAMAIAAVKGKEGLAPLDPDLIGQKKIVSFAEEIRLYEDEELTRCFPVHAPARVVVHSTKGRFEKYVKSALGDPSNPMDRKIIQQKLAVIAGQRFDTHISEKIVTAVNGLEKSDLDPLLSILGPRPDSGSPEKEIK